MNKHLIGILLSVVIVGIITLLVYWYAPDRMPQYLVNISAVLLLVTLDAIYTHYKKQYLPALSSYLDAIMRIGLMLACYAAVVLMSYVICIESIHPSPRTLGYLLFYTLSRMFVGPTKIKW